MEISVGVKGNTMADIHIGKITKTGATHGMAEVYYHIPITNPKPGVIPTPASALSGLSQAEIDALANGSLVETPISILALTTQAQAEVVNNLRADWQNKKTSYNQEYAFEYKYYGQTLNATI
jgi:hypothetical protein